MSPIERTCGLFSYHSDYNSMFAIDEEGSIWTNKESITYYLNNTYEIRYEGYLPWSYFPSANDSNNYYSQFCYKIIRGLGYVIKRNLLIGNKFIDLINHSPYLVEMGLKAKNGSDESFKRYSKAKIRAFIEFGIDLVDERVNI